MHAPDQQRLIVNPGDFGREYIAAQADGLDEGRILVVGLDFLPHATDMDIDAAFNRAGGTRMGAGKDLLAVHDLPRILAKHQQNVILPSSTTHARRRYRSIHA